MGRIKTTLAKRTTNKFFREFGEHFTKDFAKNKAIVKKLATFESKKLVNSIAGYVTRLASAKKTYKTI